MTLTAFDQDGNMGQLSVPAVVYGFDATLSAINLYLLN